MGSSTDVANGWDADTKEALRGGGFDFALIGSGDAKKTLGAPDPVTGRVAHSATIPVAAASATTSKHQIDGVATGTMWGNGAISASIADTGKAGVTLECGSCHDPHGNGNYRILKPVPNDSGAAAEVVIPDAQTKKYTTADYWLVTDRQVPATKGGALPAAGTTDGYIANASQWCSQCHTRYLAGSGSWNTPNRGYPAVAGATGPVDANFTYRHRSDRTDKDGVERPNCIQCHVSHGSNAKMAGYAADVPTPGGTAGSASSRLLRVDNRGTCVMCHNV